MGLQPFILTLSHRSFFCLLQRLISKLGVSGSLEKLDAYQNTDHTQATIMMNVRNTALVISERVHRIF
jgi:hypothetical protein